MLTNTITDIVILQSEAFETTIVRVHTQDDQGEVTLLAKAVPGLLDADKATKTMLNLWKNCQVEGFVQNLLQGGFVHCSIGKLDEDDPFAYEASEDGNAISAFEFNGNQILDVRQENELMNNPETTEEAVTLRIEKNTDDKWVITDGTHTSLPYPSRDKARASKQMYDGDPGQWKKFIKTLDEVSIETEKVTEPVQAPKKGKRGGRKIEDTKVEEVEPKEKAPRKKPENTTPIPELQDGDAIELGKMASKSDKIRFLHGLGWTPTAISKFLVVNYSFVYSVVAAQKKGKKWVNWKKNKPGYQERRRKVQSNRFRDELETWFAENPGADRPKIMEFVHWLENKTPSVEDGIPSLRKEGNFTENE